MNSEARRIGAALEHIKKTGNLQDFAGTRSERVAMIGTAITRGLVVWDKEREKYDLTPHGERRLAAYLAPESSLIRGLAAIRGLASVRTIAAVAGIGGVAMAALWLAAGSLGRMPSDDDEVPEAALIVAPDEGPAAEVEAADARASTVDHSEVAASARLRLSALPATASGPAKADPPGLAEPDFATKSAASPSAVPTSGAPPERVGAAPARAAVPPPAPEAGEPVKASLNQPAPATSAPRRPPPSAAAAGDAVPRTPTKPAPLPARRPAVAVLAATAGATPPERAEPAASTPRAADTVPTRKPGPAPATASASAPEPPRRPAEPRLAAVEGEGPRRAETRTFVYPDGTVATVVRKPRSSEAAWLADVEDALTRRSASGPRDESPSGLAYSNEERAPRRAVPGVADGASRPVDAVPARKPGPAPGTATGAGERAAAPASAPQPAAVPEGSAVRQGAVPAAEPPRRPAEPKTAAVEPPLNARPDGGAIAGRPSDRARSEPEALPSPRPDSEGSRRTETRTFYYPNGTVVTVVRERREAARLPNAEDARRFAAVPGLPDSASPPPAEGGGQCPPRRSEPDADDDGDGDLVYREEGLPPRRPPGDPDPADGWWRSDRVPERLVAPGREATPRCREASYDEQAELDWRMSAWGRRLR